MCAFCVRCTDRPMRVRRQHYCICLTTYCTEQYAMPRRVHAQETDNLQAAQRIMFGQCRRVGSRSTRTAPSPARHPNRRSHTCNASIHGRHRTARTVRSVRPVANSRPASVRQSRSQPLRAHGHQSLTFAVVWRCASCRRARSCCRPALWKCVQMRSGRASSWSARRQPNDQSTT
jgi:hypothetical protein